MIMIMHTELIASVWIRRLIFVPWLSKLYTAASVMASMRACIWGEAEVTREAEVVEGCGVGWEVICSNILGCRISCGGRASMSREDACM